MVNLNSQQEFILERAIEWWNSSEQIFQYTGGPGTGKTFLLNNIINKLGIPMERIAPMAYTGQAAVVMRGYGLSNAKTIHSWLYDPVLINELNPDGSCKLDPYFNKPITKLTFVPKDLSDIDLFIIDEGSMVPMHMREEIDSRGKKIIVTGDLDQLPPIHGNPAYLSSGTIYKLTEIMRQQKNSPIIYLAQQALNGIEISPGIYGNCKVVYTDELTDMEIMNADIMICGKNKTRDMINNNYRYNILKCTSTLPIVNEKMICRKNNWNKESEGINLVNGLIGRVTKSPGVEGFEDNIYKIDFIPLYTNGAFLNLECDYKYLIGDLKQKEILKHAPFSKGEKLEFAHAITTHMSQGGQFPNGIYVEEHLIPNIQRSLNYTAITRFKDRMIYVKNRPKNYYNINY